MRRNRTVLLWTTILVVGLILSLIVTGVYLFQINRISANTALVISQPKVYIDNGLFSQMAYAQYTVTPAQSATFDTVYSIQATNGPLTWTDKLVWTLLELDIKKPKIIKHRLSPDEYVAVQLHPHFTTTVMEITSKRNANLFYIPFLYLCLIALGIFWWKDRKPQRPRRSTPALTPIIASTPQTLTDDEQIKLCVKCPSLTSVNGTLRCNRQRCNQSQSAPVPSLRRHVKLPALSPILQVFIIGIMTALVGIGSLIFFARVTQGPTTFHEPDKVILWGEIALASCLTLGGILLTANRLKEVR